jgi:hypothetical protein
MQDHRSDPARLLFTRMTKKPPPKDVFIGKFDILATYAYARALLDGLDDDEAKQRGMVAAITWGAKDHGQTV